MRGAGIVGAINLASVTNWKGEKCVNEQQVCWLPDEAGENRARIPRGLPLANTHPRNHLGDVATC